MNNIAEENENQKMNTETVEKQEDVSSPEITGEETVEELLDIYESSLKKFEEGQVVTGTVISVGRDTVLVDVGYKSEGQISISEFIDEQGNVNVNVNDKFEVMIEVWDEEEETVLLSHEKYINQGLPIIKLYGTLPQKRLSFELSLLSPII